MTYVERLLGQNESVVLVARESCVVLVREAVIDLIVAVVIIALAMVAFGALALGLPQVPSFIGGLLLLLLLVPILRFAWQYLKWRNREYIVTNRRVIQLHGTVNKEVIDSSLEKVNDVRMSQSALGRILDYGDVEILTASELGTNLFRMIASPIKFKTAMLNEKEKLGFSEIPTNVSPSGTPKAPDIPTMIASLSAMRSQGIISEEEFQQKKAELLSRM